MDHRTAEVLLSGGTTRHTLTAGGDRWCVQVHVSVPYLSVSHGAISVESEAAHVDGLLWVHLTDRVVQFIHNRLACWETQVHVSGQGKGDVI